MLRQRTESCHYRTFQFYKLIKYFNIQRESLFLPWLNICSAKWIKYETQIKRVYSGELKEVVLLAVAIMEDSKYNEYV